MMTSTTGSRAVWWIVGIPLVLISASFGLFLYLSVSQARWDSRVRELCARDGGVTVFETISVSPEEFAALPTTGGLTAIPTQSAMGPKAPAFFTSTETVVSNGNPRVTRQEHLVKRSSDGKVIGRIVSYSRVGGDIPTIAHPSSFHCPDYKKLTADQAQFFQVERKSK